MITHLYHEKIIRTPTLEHIYFSISKLRSHGLISEDRGRVDSPRSMPSMPFLLDSDLNVVGGSENNDGGDEYGFTTSNIKISDVDLILRCGCVLFGNSEGELRWYEDDLTCGNLEVHENVPRLFSRDLERLNEDESRREVRRSSDEYENRGGGDGGDGGEKKEVTRAKRVTMMIRPHPIFKI